MNALQKLLTGGQVVAYYPALARAVGGIAPALFLQQIAHWSGYSKDGWVFRTVEQLEEELAMSHKVQATSRRKLVDGGFLEEKRRGQNRLHYKIKWDKVEAALHTLPTGNSKPDQRETLNCPKGDSINKSIDKTEDNISPEGGADAPAKVPEDHTGKLIDDLKEIGVCLDRDEIEKISGNFGALKNAGVGHGELVRVRQRMVSEWPRIQLSPQRALDDIRGHRNGNGAKPAKNGNAKTPDIDTGSNTAEANARRKEGYEYLFN